MSSAPYCGRTLQSPAPGSPEPGHKSAGRRTLESPATLNCLPLCPIVLVIVALIVGLARAGNDLPLYLDPGQPIEKRVEDLLGRMTLSEKVGQMNMPVVYLETFGRNAAEKRDACRRFALGAMVPGLGPGGGFFTLADNALPEGPRQQAEFFNELQRLATEQTRLKIPLLQTEEGTHGVMCSGKTIFPEGPAIGSTWNMDLVRGIYSAAALEARAVGIHQLFTLVIEPNRDPRLGRNEEGYSEDPYFVRPRCRGHCSRSARQGCVGARQSRGRPLPLSRPEPAGQRF